MGLPQEKFIHPDSALRDTHQALSTGRVIATLSSHQVTVSVDGREQNVNVATHVPLLVPGQAVLIAQPHGLAGIVIAAYGSAGEAATSGQHGETVQTTQAPLIQYDATTGTLSIEANQVNLKGVGVIELRSGTAVLRLNAQGEALTQAEAITHAAIGPYRVEGASIDMN